MTYIETPIDMLPEEVACAYKGGPNYGEAAYAGAVVNGQIPAGEIRKITGVDENGNPIYAGDLDVELPNSYIGPYGQRHRQPVRSRR